jgi:hypothetical protein
MVMDDLPCSSLQLIDVRNPVIDGCVMSAKLELPVFSARFACDIPTDLDKLIFEFNLSVRGYRTIP